MKKEFKTVGLIPGASMLCKEKTDGDNTGGGASAVSKKEALSADNIEKSIDDGICMSEAAAKDAAEAIKKQNKERRIEEMKSVILRSDYTTNKVLLRLRKTRAQEKVDKAFLDGIGALQLEATSGKHDKHSWEAAYKKLYDERQKGYRDADKRYDEYCQKLKTLFPNSWSYEWDYNLSI